MSMEKLHVFWSCYVSRPPHSSIMAHRPVLRCVREMPSTLRARYNTIYIYLSRRTRRVNNKKTKKKNKRFFSFLPILYLRCIIIKHRRHVYTSLRSYESILYFQLLHPSTDLSSFRLSVVLCYQFKPSPAKWFPILHQNNITLPIIFVHWYWYWYRISIRIGWCRLSRRKMDTFYLVFFIVVCWTSSCDRSSYPSVILFFYVMPRPFNIKIFPSYFGSSQLSFFPLILFFITVFINCFLLLYARCRLLFLLLHLVCLELKLSGLFPLFLHSFPKKF